jgi:hypothetical protein
MGSVGREVARGLVGRCDATAFVGTPEAAAATVRVCVVREWKRSRPMPDRESRTGAGVRVWLVAQVQTTMLLRIPAAEDLAAVDSGHRLWASGMGNQAAPAQSYRVAEPR